MPTETKPSVLRAMHELPTHPKDIWNYDGISLPGTKRSYERSFESILKQLKVDSFQSLVDNMSRKLKKPINIADLFGGAFFLNNLENVREILGVRLKNVDSNLVEFYEEENKQKASMYLDYNIKLLKNLIGNKKRSILEGNLYKKETWEKISEGNQKDNPCKFDLIVCRPEGPFLNASDDVQNIEKVEDDGVNREEIFVMLLERALKLLSKDGGLLFTQIPNLETPDNVWNKFWEEYIQKKESEGYEFLLGEGRKIPNRQTFAIRRTR